MTDEMTRDLPGLAALYAERLESYQVAQREASDNPGALGFQIAMKRESEQLLVLRDAIEKEGGIIDGKNVYDSKGENLTT